MVDSTLNPAEIAAEEAQARVYAAINEGKSFLVEAGAGAGKTESLIKALKYLIKNRGAELLHKNQRVACITFTNVATDEIKSRTDGHPAILSSTIHSFCWTMIRDFQPHMRERLSALPGWPERLAEAGGIGGRRIEYELGYPRARKEEDYVSLGHDDVISLTVILMQKPKFRNLLTARYPVLLIDEYQDTNEKFTNALITHFLDGRDGPLIGFFGDHWQKIYGDGCGRIEHTRLLPIKKEANFRSVPVIVEALNRMRPKLPQQVTDPDAEGIIAIYHTNDWIGKRRKGQHWEGDLPPDVAHNYFLALKERLSGEGWNFEADKTKILMLTHRLLAAEQGYSSFADIFPYNDAFLKKEDPHIAFLVDTVEPACMAYEKRLFGEMFEVLGEHQPAIQSPQDKKEWANAMEGLIKLRTTGKIGNVLDYLGQTKRPRLPDAVQRKARELEQARQSTISEESPSIEMLGKLRDVSYREIIALDHYIDGHTPFSTKHGVKGAEFENVLVIFGRGWNQYDFNQMLEWAGNRIPPGKEAVFERNRNLFYVVCSRPKKRLGLLFTQKLSPKALHTLTLWFGESKIKSIVTS